jgi:retinoblastoma-like protein 1
LVDDIFEHILLGRLCTCDPKEKIAEWVKEMGQLFCARYTQHTEDHPGTHMDFAVRRLRLGENLYYKLLENILVEERKKKPDLDLTVFISSGILSIYP